MYQSPHLSPMLTEIPPLDYARQANVDPERGVCIAKSLIQKYDATNREATSEEEEDVTGDAGPSAKDRWNWANILKEYKQLHHPLGGHQHDITKFSRRERADAAYDGKDPLANISLVNIRKGNFVSVRE